MLLRVVSQEAIKMETRVQAGFYLVLKVYSPLQKRLLTTRNIFDGSLVFFLLFVWPAKVLSFLSSRGTISIQLIFAFGDFYLFGKQWPREILCSLPIICSRFAENPNIIYVSIGAAQSFASSCEYLQRAGAQNFSAPTEMYKIYIARDAAQLQQ